MKILVLGYEEDLKYVRKTIEDLEETTTVFETSTLEGFIALAKDKAPLLAIIDDRLLQNENGRGRNLSQLVSEILIFPDLRQFLVQPFIQVRRRQCEDPSLIHRMIKAEAKGFWVKGTENGCILFKTKTEILNINKRQIIFIESYKGKCSIHTRKRVIEVRQSLKDLEDIMGEDFFRVHRSFLVNINEIKRVRNICDRSYEIEFLDSDETAIMSRYRYQVFQEYVKKFSTT
ncbi:MAG TPA: LytTR family DNA-binding domain-containing protein [Syntrophomonadaceae bacterium]|nr:LytTR family DNA-binding domain-containing protein [Syntrophomonadaceae bacterium]